MNPGPKRIIHTAWVFSPQRTGLDLVKDAAVAFESGRILATGPINELRQNHPDAQLIDATDSILLPGLINPHTHLELSLCSNCPPSASFTDWILSLAGRIGLARDFDAATRSGIEQCLRFGVTTVGDISQQMQITRPILAQSPLRAISYGEVLGLAKIKFRYAELFPQAIDHSFDSENFLTGITPHSPYTVDLPGFVECLETAKRLKLPIATHLAELPFEEEFLRHHTGPLRELYETLKSWSEPLATFAGSPIQFAHHIGLLYHPTLLAHVNYCNDDELALLAKGRASVVYCPRTHRYFNHPPHRFREMLAAGINVAVGTDSCASSPNLNVLDDLRLVHEIHPEILLETLFTLVTQNASRALQMEDKLGSLSPGKFADFTLFHAASDNPLHEILESDALPTDVYINGEQVPPAQLP
jgi:cytosine/adenosine deaminase-related metal-dependent hydrolase